jgi:hypothetical protein
VRRFAAKVLLALGAAGVLPGTGCDVSPLQDDLDPSSVGGQAVEFYVSPMSPLGNVLSTLLAEREADTLKFNLPALQGSLGGTLEFVTNEGEVEIPVSDLGAEILDGKLQVSASLGATEATVLLDVYAEGEQLRTCFLRLIAPEREFLVALAFSVAGTNGPDLAVCGAPEITGPPVTVELDFDCPEQPGSEVQSVVVGSIEEGIQGAMLEFASGLAEVAGSAVGTGSGTAGSVEDLVDFLVQPDAEAAEMGADDLRIGLRGGFESRRAPCVPTDAVDLPPGEEPPADFPQMVPDTIMTYGMGISISKGFLKQGLAAAYRGGMLCRRAGAGDLPDVRLDDLFPSLQKLGYLSAVRAALWPGGQPEVEFTPPEPNSAEELPRLVLTLPRLTLDVYGSLEWTDVRLLSVTADVLLILSPRLEDGSLSFLLVEAHIGSMDINFSKLLDEDDDDLRAGAIAAAERVIARMVEDIGRLEFPRPASAGGRLLGSTLEGGRILLYFAP